MKKVTLSLPEDVYRCAENAATTRDMSLSAWVQELVVAAFGTSSDDAQRKALQERVIASIDSFDASDRLPRDEIHRR